MTVSSALNSSASKFLAAPCPAGKRIVGGGAYVSDAGGFASQVALVGSYPNVTSWGAAAHEIGLFLGNWRLTVKAVCASVAA